MTNVAIQPRKRDGSGLSPSISGIPIMIINGLKLLSQVLNRFLGYAGYNLLDYGDKLT
jgi:hypothetical protein